MRFLPAVLRHRPSGVEGSLKVVEAFFGANISSKMVDAATRLSEGQMKELEGQLSETSFHTHAALGYANRTEKLVPESFIDSLRKSRLERDFEKLLPTRAQDDVFWPQRHIINAEEIGTHEDLLPLFPLKATGLDICSAPALKHMALYCQQTTIRDPLYTSYGALAAYQKNASVPNNEVFSLDAQRRRLANGIRQLLPIAPLIRSGAFVLANDDSPNQLFTRSTGKNDPFLWWLLGQYRPDLQQEMAELYATPAPRALGGEEERRHWQLAQRLWKLEPQAQQVVRAHYPYPMSDAAWQRMIAFSKWTYSFSLAPFTSDPEIVRHLQHGTQIAFDTPPNEAAPPRTARLAAAPSSLAVAYQVPALYDTSFADIARLRDSDLFAEVRAATVALAKTCAESSPPDFDAYQQLVAESSQDIVGPLYRTVEHKRRLGKWAKLGIAAGSKVLGVEIGGVAGKLAATAAKELGTASLERRKSANQTTHSILRSLLDYR